MSTQSKVNKMSEQKINKTYIGAIDQISTLKKVFRENGKLQNAILESNGDTSVLSKINRAFDTLSEALTSAITNEQLNEGVLDDGDEDGFMARSQLYFLAKDAISLHGMIDDRDDLEPWVHSKIVSASEAMDAVRRYIEYRSMAGTQEPEMEPTAEPSNDEKLMGSYGEGIDEDFSDQVTDFGMFSKGGNAQVQNMIQYILRDFDEDAEKAGNSEIYALRMDALKRLFRELEEMAEDGYEEAMDTEVRQRAATYLDKGMTRIMDTLDNIDEGWETLPAMPDKYVERDGLEGPFMTRSGKVVYYDPKAGSYYDPDSDHFLSYDEWKALDGDAPLRNESADDEENHYLVVHAKKGTTKVSAKTSYEAAKKAAAGWKLKSTAGIDAHLMTADKEVAEGFKIRNKSRGYGVSDETYKTRDEAKNAALMRAAHSGGEWEVIEEGMNFDDKRTDDLQAVAKDMFKHAKEQAKKSLKVKKS